VNRSDCYLWAGIYKSPYDTCKISTRFDLLKTKGLPYRRPQDKQLLALSRQMHSSMHRMESFLGDDLARNSEAVRSKASSRTSSANFVVFRFLMKRFSCNGVFELRVKVRFSQVASLDQARPQFTETSVVINR
jgi:hypothetical protein